MQDANNKVRNAMSLEFLSLPENVGLARITVASFAAQEEMTLNDLEEIKVAVSEAVSNCILHGYNSSVEGLIKIKATLYTNKLIIEVKDEGKGIPDINLALQPAYSTNPERMGLGFVFMNSFMDKVIVHSKLNKGTTVIMEKKLKTTKQDSKHDRNIDNVKIR
ncbi:MAG: anti-sigma F factor [Bacillota bacterium]